MPLPNRRTLLSLGLPLTAFAVGAPYSTYRWLIPSSPLDANMAQLGRWLVTNDVTAEPREVQEKLVDHIQESLPELLKVSSTEHDLSPTRQKRLVANANHLQRVWFELRSHQHSQIPKNEARVAFLREQVTTLIGLSKIAKGLLASTKAKGGKKGGDAMREFLDNIRQWQDDAPQGTRRAMREIVRDGLLVYLGYFDLTDMKQADREVLAIRVAETLDRHGESALPPVRLVGPVNQSLQVNAELLLEAWFRVQAEEFDDVAEANRPAIVKGLVVRVQAWNLGELLSSDGSSSPKDQMKMLLRLQHQITMWIARAHKRDRPKMQRLAAAVQQHLVWGSMKALMPSLAPAPSK
jgi:hypothetical protein